MMDGKVGGSHAESHSVRDVVDGLDETVGVEVAVGAAGDAVSGLQLGLGLGSAGVAVVVLANFVLGMILRTHIIGNRGSSNNGDSVGHRGSVNNNLRSLYILNNRTSLAHRKVVGIVGSVGKVGVGNQRRNDRSSGNGRFSVISNFNGCGGSSISFIHNMNREIGCTYTESQGISNVIDTLN